MAIKIRDLANFVRTIKFTHSSATYTDTVYLLGGRPMLAMNSIPANTPNTFLAAGLIEYTAETGISWVSGDVLFWDNTNSKFTKTLTGNTKCGIAGEDKPAASALGLVLLQIIP